MQLKENSFSTDTAFAFIISEYIDCSALWNVSCKISMDFHVWELWSCN